MNTTTEKELKTSISNLRIILAKQDARLIEYRALIAASEARLTTLEARIAILETRE